jgi:hypothetical protein
VSKRRLAIGAALIVGAVVSAAPSAQEPSLDEVLKKAAAYVADFRRQLSEIVAEETYRQEIAYTARIGAGMGMLPRTLKSDLVLIKPADADRYVELRDVYEVNGKQVRPGSRGSKSCCATIPAAPTPASSRSSTRAPATTSAASPATSTPR